MSKTQTIVEFDELINLTLSKAHLHHNDRLDLANELKQHLYDHYQELIIQRMSHESAIRETIEQFGKPKAIQKRINQTYPNTLREFILRELIIVIILIAALLIGPLFLISRYRLESMLAGLPIPFVILLFTGFFRYFVLNKVKSYKVQLAITVLIYMVLVMLMINHYSGLSLSFVMRELSLFSLTNYVNGSEGIFTLQTLHLFWIIILIMQRIQTNSTLTIKQRMVRSSYQYWSVILFGLCIAIFVPSNSESQLVFINIFLITSFLEQVVTSHLLVFMKKKFSHLGFRD